MRRSREAAAETRVRIVQSAAVAFRQNGIDRTAVNDLMGAAGLTHGGFYKHFSSKEQLVAEACASAIDTLAEVLAGTADGAGEGCGLRAMAGDYLSSVRRDDPGTSCPLAMLGSEIAHHDEGTRAAATTGFHQLAELVAAEIPEADLETRRLGSVTTLCAMIGALTMSRMVNDEVLSETILSSMRDAVETGHLRPPAEATRLELQ